MAKTKEIHVKGFFLRSVGKKANGNLYYRVNREGVSLTICTGISVDVKKWRAATQSTAKWNDYTSEESYIDDNGNDEDVMSLIKKAQNAYDKAIECQKNGDWEGYGKYIKQLENYLTKLANESGTSKSAAAPAEETAAEPAEETADEAA